MLSVSVTIREMLMVIYIQYIFLWINKKCISVEKCLVLRGKDPGYKSALNPVVIYSIYRSKVVIQELVLLFVALWFISSHWLKRYCAHTLFTSLTRLL